MTALRCVTCSLLACALSLACQRAPRAVPTYSEQVAPILERRCLPCHSDGPGSASVSPALGSAEQAQRVAAQIALSVERRRMPPWGADNTGNCGRFADAAWLDDREILTLRAWTAGGAPAGPARSVSAAAPRNGLQGPFAWLLDPAPGERKLRLSTQFTPGLGAEATRCFRSDVALEGDWSIGALAVKSEPSLAVQQLLVYAITDLAGLEDVRRLEAEDAEPGWACYAGSRVPNSELVASWSWLQPLQRLPVGSRAGGRPDLPLVLQLRYNLIGTGLERRAVHASAELVLRSPQRGARLWPVAVSDLRLRAGQRRVETVAEVTLAEPLDLLGVVPQMHGLGRTLVLERERAGQRSCLASFAHWNPAQQQLYRHVRAFELEPGDRIRLSCTFDTSSRSEDVLGGQSIDEEECRAHLYVAERRPVGVQ